jgi:hypothetical protein
LEGGKVERKEGKKYLQDWDGTFTPSSPPQLEIS